MELTSRDRLERAEKSLKYIDSPQGVMQNAVFSIAMSLTVIADVVLTYQEDMESLISQTQASQTPTPAQDEDPPESAEDMESEGEQEQPPVGEPSDDGPGSEDLPDLSSDDEDDTDEED